MICSSLMSCTGQLMWKLANTAEHAFLIWCVGFFIYGIGAVLMIVALRFGEVSILQPMLGIGFVLSLLLGYVVMGEPITATKVIGVLFIITGMIFLGRSGAARDEK